MTAMDNASRVATRDRVAPHLRLIGCRGCGGPLERVWDLGERPLANSFGGPGDWRWAPLCLCACRACDLVQLDAAVDARVLFASYSYTTPSSASLAAHYAMLDDAILAHAPKRRTIVEMGSNNGELLHFLKQRWGIEIDVLGVEPAHNVAEQARARGIPTECEFFGPASVERLIATHGQSDVLIARHCLAHLHDLRGTLAATAAMVRDGGLVVIENAYLMDTIRGTQFDQIYHEHMSYFAVAPMRRMLREAGLTLVSVRRAPVHGGSICLFAIKRASAEADASVSQCITDELGMRAELRRFVTRSKDAIASIDASLRELRAAGQTVAAYGASAKGTMLLSALSPQALGAVSWCVDSTSWKIGTKIPGAGIEVRSESQAVHPDVYLLTAWNYADEIVAKHREFIEHGGRFLVPLPAPWWIA